MTIHVENLPIEAQKALAQFPEFQISEFNDSGANGYVLLGRHTVLKKDVAIKIYFHEVGAIDQEPSIIASINHPNVLKVFDARKVESDCSFFLMPSANEGSLSKYLEKFDICLPLAHKLLCQLLSGLSELHREPNRLVHRDLKPENLLVHDDKIVIADFGSVRRIDEVTGQAPASKHSILYRPPEAFGDKAHFNFSSDIYQVGLIGFLLFGGKISNDLLTYLNAKEIIEFHKIENTKGAFDVAMYIDSCIQKKIDTNKLVDWDTFPFYVPANIKKMIKTAISASGKRPSTVSQFLAALSRARGDLPDWIPHADGFLLRNWNGTDYLIHEAKNAVLKKKHTSKDFRVDNSITGSNSEQLYASLKNKCGFL
jgi:serine/threonine protein kinase